MLEEKFLPLGTIVLLKEAKKRIMIVGYVPQAEDEEGIVQFDYVGCLYPEGMISSDKNLLFNHDQIDKIFFKGLDDEEAINFKKKLIEYINDPESFKEKINSNKQQESEERNPKTDNGIFSELNQNIEILD